MKVLITLKEVCKTVGVSRRAVQGYEEHGLVKSATTNKYGHLLYDEKNVETIKMIKCYQRFGFRLSEIECLMQASDVEIKCALQNQLEVCKKQSKEMERIIVEIQKMIDQL